MVIRNKKATAKPGLKRRGNRLPYPYGYRRCGYLQMRDGNEDTLTGWTFQIPADVGHELLGQEISARPLK